MLQCDAVRVCIVHNVGAGLSYVLEMHGGDSSQEERRFFALRRDPSVTRPERT